MRSNAVPCYICKWGGNYHYDEPCRRCDILYEPMFEPAPLYAAAPDMLEALESVCEFDCDLTECGECMIGKAIAKAKGGNNE